MDKAFAKKDIEFSSHGTLCRGWLFVPAAGRPMRSPCIVMAHGLGGTIDCGLESFAEHFARNGFTVLVFDYRHFGGSDGMPRQVLEIGKQIEDWQAAFEFARALPMVDSRKVGLWGTSFSSGHILSLAARDTRIAAVCAQNPMVDGLAAALALANYAGMLKLAQMALYGTIDYIRAWSGFSPLTMPIVAEEGALAGLSTKGALEGYLSIAGPTWVNRMTTRMAVTLTMYRPILSAKKIRCQTLLQAGRIDVVTPPKDAVSFAQRAGSNVSLKQYDMGHFDFYIGENQQRILKDQTEFFHRALG